MILEYVLLIVLGIAVNGLLLWLAIVIADHGNQRNKIYAAFGWALVLMGAQYWPFVGLLLGLVVLMLVLMNYYCIGFLRSVLVIIVLMSMNVGLILLLGGPGNT